MKASGQMGTIVAGQGVVRCFAVLLFCCSAVAAIAEAPDRSELLAALDAESFEAREAATQALLADETLDEAGILTMLEEAKSPEQQHRLMRVARHRVLTAARLEHFKDDANASLGISHEVVNLRPDPEAAPRAAVRVILTLPGFPGHTALRPGDLVTAIDGQTFPAGFTGQGFAAAVRAYEPGQAVTLTVIRDENTIEVPVTLASGAALEAMYDTGSVGLTFQFAATWRQARQRFLEAMPAAPVLEAEEEDAADGDG